MDTEYRVDGEIVRLEADPSVVAIRFHDEVPRSARAEATEAVEGMRPFTTRYEVPGERLTLVPVTPPAEGGIGPEAAIDGLDRRPEVAKALPVFRVGSNKVVATDRVILALNPGGELPAVLQRHGLRLLNESEERAVARIPDDADIFDVCRKLDADAAVDYAEPDFTTIGRHIPSRAPVAGPSAPATQQYAMVITRAFEAQALVQGRPEVRIAILDEGVDSRHPEFGAAVVGTFDALDADAYQEPNAWDGHGTACAGLAAANGSRVRGSGAGCSLLAVRIAMSEGPGANWQTSNETIARAVDWSWREGRADVLSNSWGGGAPSNAVSRAFRRARTLGRGGLGCVVVVAAGNDGIRTHFPGTLPDVLTVSASNEYDEIKSRTSADGESFWASNYGPEISVAAPGVHNLTTDISGPGGYVAGSFTPTFNGTSSSCPIVAGGCALLICANPGLTEREVRTAICETADKIGKDPYVNDRNDRAGYGRLNLLRAVRRVADAPRPPVA